MRHSAAGFQQLLRTTFSTDSSRSRDDLERFQAKINGYVRRPDGSHIPITMLICEILQASPVSLLQFQLVQERSDLLVLKVLTAEPKSSSALADLGNSLRSLLGEQVRSRLQRVSESLLKKAEDRQP